MLPACMSVHRAHARPLEGRREPYSSGTGVRDGSELPRGCCKSNLGPLQEQQMFLTAEPPVKPLEKYLLMYEQFEYG